MVDRIDPVEEFSEMLHWTVLFLRGSDERQHPFQIFTPKDWRHCLAYGWSNDRWIVYDVGDKRSQIHVLTDDQFDNWNAQITPRVTAGVKIETLERTLPVARIGLWCVTAIKHLTGIRSGAFTPKALFRDLLANGGKVSEFYGQAQRTQGHRE